MLKIKVGILADLQGNKMSNSNYLLYMTGIMPAFQNASFSNAGLERSKCCLGGLHQPPASEGSYQLGGDVYFQAYHFHSFNSISWEASSKQIYTWQGPSSVPLFEFHDEKHFMEFYLNFKMPFFKRCSFGQQVQQLGDPNHLTSTLFTSILLL